MSINILQSKIYKQNAENQTVCWHFNLSVTMATNQNEEFEQPFYTWSKNISEEVLSKHLQWDCK